MAGRGVELRRLCNVSNKPILNNLQSTVKEDNPELLAKYSYKANPDSPGGFDEIDIKQGETLWLLKRGTGDNHHWWQVKKKDETFGFVPARYVMIVEKKVTSLPWLNKEPEKEEMNPGNKFGIPKFKPYVSAYGSGDEPSKEKASVDEFYCDVCSRKFNGPIPYKAHMNSKAHKEEEEIAKQYSS
uniref:cytoplasmic protein NCK1-like n=1 Tax=Styela clava TaxID=7725 RepID=UPI00193A1A2F|nr:cytoplasmic protein NCK1-like [Styela clava]XP_039248662.1 cytoplasmic protein NCK1-like [Styela clava]